MEGSFLFVMIPKMLVFFRVFGKIFIAGKISNPGYRQEIFMNSNDKEGMSKEDFDRLVRGHEKLIEAIGRL